MAKQQLKRYAGEGAKGGCFFEIEETDEEDIAYLEVGWSCVIIHRRLIPVTWLSELIAIATAHPEGIKGFLKETNYLGDSYALKRNPDDPNPTGKQNDRR